VELVTDYLEAAGHGDETAGALFRPVKNNTGRTVEGAITADGIYKMVQHYAKRVGVNIEGFGAHSLRATAATNALDHEDALVDPIAHRSVTFNNWHCNVLLCHSSIAHRANAVVKVMGLPEPT
jgi:integrase